MHIVKSSHLRAEKDDTHLSRETSFRTKIPSQTRHDRRIRTLSSFFLGDVRFFFLQLFYAAQLPFEDQHQIRSLARFAILFCQNTLGNGVLAVSLSTSFENGILQIRRFHRRNRMSFRQHLVLPAYHTQSSERKTTRVFTYDHSLDNIIL